MTASDGEAPVLELGEVVCTHFLQLLPHPLWPRMIEPVRILSMGQIDLFKNY